MKHCDCEQEYCERNKLHLAGSCQNAASELVGYGMTLCTQCDSSLPEVYKMVSINRIVREALQELTQE